MDAMPPGHGANEFVPNFIETNDLLNHARKWADKSARRLEFGTHTVRDVDILNPPNSLIYALPSENRQFIIPIHLRPSCPLVQLAAKGVAMSA